MISKLLKSIVFGVALNIYASSDNIYVFLTTEREMSYLKAALNQPEISQSFLNPNESNQLDGLKEIVQVVFNEKPKKIIKEEAGTIHAFLANKKINGNNFIRMSKKEFLVFDGSSGVIQDIVKQEMLMFHGYGYESDFIKWSFMHIEILRNINSKNSIQLKILPDEIFVSLDVFNILLQNHSKLTCRFPKLTNVSNIEEAKSVIPRIQFFDNVIFFSMISIAPIALVGFVLLIIFAR